MDGGRPAASSWRSASSGICAGGPSPRGLFATTSVRILLDATSHRLCCHIDGGLVMVVNTPAILRQRGQHNRRRLNRSRRGGVPRRRNNAGGRAGGFPLRRAGSDDTHIGKKVGAARVLAAVHRSNPLHYLGLDQSTQEIGWNVRPLRWPPAGRVILLQRRESGRYIGSAVEEETE